MKKPGIQDRSLELMGLLHALARRYLFQARMRGAAGGVGLDLTRQEARVMGATGERPAWTMGELAAELVVAMGSLTVIVDRLVRKGLLHRERATEDRRVVRVKLTAAGHRLALEHQRHRLQMARAMLGALDEGEQAVFLRMMRKIRERTVGGGHGDRRAGWGRNRRKAGKVIA
jgi:DNA-binding MarR family transcriptional regulator